MAVQEDEALTGKIHPEKRDLRALGTAAVALLVWHIISWQFPFFWDTVLNAKIAHWYLESDFAQLTVPERLDAGHPPFFNLYLAGIWAGVGKSLTAAHLALLPFLLVLLVQYWKLAVRFLPENVRAWALVLLFCEPTFLAQSSMITPDIVLVAMFLTSINAVLEGRRLRLALALIVMASVTFRGILAVPAVFLIEVGLGWQAGRRKPDWGKILAYLPVGGLTLVWLWVHYRAVGWLLTPPPETYGAHRKLVGIGTLARNLGIVGWRFLDFGRIAVWLVVLGALVAGGRRSVRNWPDLRRLGWMFLAPAALWTLLFIPFSNPIGMRYFLSAYLLLMLIALGLVAQWPTATLRRAGRLGMALVLISGHFWVYPDSIAKSWDSSLAHLPYFGLQRDLAEEMAVRGIDPAQVCTDFPMLAPPRFAYVRESAPPFGRDLKATERLGNCEFVLWSNISNGFEAAEWEILDREFTQVLDRQKGAVRMRLFRRVGVE
ncbi:MAG: hypothetical protein AAGN35_07550 [Bacteroidota bacterium]